MCFDDWIVGNSIGSDPLIYIEGWSYLSRKLPNIIFKFSTFKIGPKPTWKSNRLGNSRKVGLANS